jgi:hypothetical protein
LKKLLLLPVLAIMAFSGSAVAGLAGNGNGPQGPGNHDCRPSTHWNGQECVHNGDGGGNCGQNQGYGNGGNDNGYGNKGDCEETTTTVVYDKCKNIQGVQSEVPEGYTRNSDGYCFPVETTITVTVPTVTAPPTVCPDGLPPNAGKDGKPSHNPNDDCDHTPVTPPVTTVETTPPTTTTTPPVTTTEPVTTTTEAVTTPPTKKKVHKKAVAVKKSQPVLASTL